MIKILFQTLLAITLFCSTSVLPVETKQEPAQFLSSLEGSWIGKAEITPIGPVRYNITFNRTSKKQVEGAAKLKAAIHYWTFYEDENRLKLRFLTTFSGNTSPINLEVREWDKNGILFQAKKPKLLSVRVTPSLDQLLIDVFHWDKLHVSIRLKKFNNHSHL